MKAAVLSFSGWLLSLIHISKEFARWCMNEREETFIPALPMAARLAEMWGGADGFPLSVKEGRAFLESRKEKLRAVSPQRREELSGPVMAAAQDICCLLYTSIYGQAL